MTALEMKKGRKERQGRKTESPDDHNGKRHDDNVNRASRAKLHKVSTSTQGISGGVFYTFRGPPRIVIDTIRDCIVLFPLANSVFHY
jgi:hypothetical protein